MKTKKLTIDETKTLLEIKNLYGDELSEIAKEYKKRTITVKKLPQKTPCEKIIDKFIEGESIDSIKIEMKLPYHDVENTLINYGLI